MKILDRILSIPEEKARPDNEAYLGYREGVSWVGIGGAAFIGGMAVSAILGVEFGADVAFGGVMVAWAGGVRASVKMGELEDMP